MASKEAVAQMRCEENREHWRAIHEQGSTDCGWANLALVFDAEITDRERAIQAYIDHFICDWDHRKDYFGDGTSLDEWERNLFLAADPLLSSKARKDTQ